MTSDDYLTRAEVATLDALHMRSIPTQDLAADVAGSLHALGYIEHTWAGRTRLTTAGRALFDIAGASA